MAYMNSMWAVVGVIAFAGAVAPVRADTTVATISSSVAQEVSTSSAAPACEGFSPDEARRLARESQRSGAHLQAAECFRIAGDHLRAHRAMMRAAADTSADASRKAAASAEIAKTQARRVREAFR